MINMKTTFKKQMCIQKGHWWALIDEKDGWRTWTLIGSVKETPDAPKACSLYSLALLYYSMGILGSLVTEGLRENGVDGEVVKFQSEKQLHEIERSKSC